MQHVTAISPNSTNTCPSDAASTCLSYDAQGRLVTVTTSGSQTSTDTYLYRRDGTPLELVRTQSGVTSKYWYEVDGRSNVIALTDAAGSVVDRYAYDLWGKLASSSESVPPGYPRSGSSAMPAAGTTTSWAGIG